MAQFLINEIRNARWHACSVFMRIEYSTRTRDQTDVRCDRAAKCILTVNECIVYLYTLLHCVFMVWLYHSNLLLLRSPMCAQYNLAEYTTVQLCAAVSSLFWFVFDPIFYQRARQQLECKRCAFVGIARYFVDAKRKRRTRRRRIRKRRGNTLRRNCGVWVYF